MYIVTLKCVIFVFMKVFNNKTQAKGSKQKVRAGPGCGFKIIQEWINLVNPQSILSKAIFFQMLSIFNYQSEVSENSCLVD